MATLTSETLFEAAQQLAPAEQENLEQKLRRLRLNRRAPQTPEEKELLRRVREKQLSPAEWRHYEALHRKHQEGALTDGEREEYLGWIEKSEVLHAERLQAVFMLAQLKNVAPQEMMRRLKIAPRRSAR